MNLQTAAIVGGLAFLLSALAALLGGVPFFDVLVRAVFWGAVGFGLSLGIESVLKSLLPDLFVPVEPVAEEADEPEAGRRVDITLEDEEGPAGVFEDVEDDEPAPLPRRRAVESEVVEAPSAETPAPAAAAATAPEPDEEMPEIGAFLDAFKPNAPEDQGEEGGSAPEYAEYAPVEQPDRRSSREVTIDGEVQDPVILAKAIQTVMKRGQGN